MSGSIERISLKAEHAGVSEETIALHMERYEFAANLVKDASVLDIACGVGYGSSLLHKKGGAASVLGVDIAVDAISEAKAEYETDAVRFLLSDYAAFRNPRGIPEPYRSIIDAKFDAIVSLETIEHLPDPDDFLETVLKHLRPGGTFIGSVPVTPSMDANPYHLQDFTPSSFRALFLRHGLNPFVDLVQIQPFNPTTVRGEMNSGQRQGLRTNMGQYYLKNPSKLCLRAWSTLRYGFTNRYQVLAARLEN